MTTTDPAAFGPSGTEPAATEPAATEPAATEPAATGPDIAEAREPASAETGDLRSASDASVSGAGEAPAGSRAADEEPEAASGDETAPDENLEHLEGGWNFQPTNDGSPAFSTALVTSVTLDLPNQHPVILLRESEPPGRHISFAVSMADAVALAHSLRRIPTPRPGTHELTGDILQRFDIDIVAVRLVGRSGSIYFAELDLRGRDRHSVHSCRPSDALTLAMRQPVPAPILVDLRLWEPDVDVEPPTYPA